MILALRMAEVTGKMALARQKNLPDDPELETEWQKLLAAGRTLRKGKN